MKTYQRVLPRDLFNEAKLLSDMGHLYLLYHDGLRDLRNCIEIFHQNDHGYFHVDQDQGDGSIEISNITVRQKDTNRSIIRFATGVNSREKHPLQFTSFQYEKDSYVFDDALNFDPDFIELLKLGRDKNAAPPR